MSRRSKLPESVDLGALLVEHEWGGGVKFVVAGSMSAVARDGEVHLEPGWRADVYLPGQRKALITIVDESPASLFCLLADLCKSGRMEISRKAGET